MVIKLKNVISVNSKSTVNKKIINKLIFNILKLKIKVLKDEYRVITTNELNKILNDYSEFIINEKNINPEKIVYHIDIPLLEGKKDIWYINFHLRETELEKDSKHIIYFKVEFNTSKDIYNLW